MTWWLLLIIVVGGLSLLLAGAALGVYWLGYLMFKNW